MTHEGLMVKATNGVAVAGVTLPAWHPALAHASDIAAQLVPILSAIWLLAQIIRLIAKWWKESGEGGAVKLGWWSAGGIASAAVLAAAVPGVSYWEGRSLRAYQDIVGVWTICDGVTAGVRPGDKATPAECDTLLMQELRKHAEGLAGCVNDDIERRIPTQTAAALLSWTYNVGVGAACRSTLVRRLNAAEWGAVCPELSRWTRAGGRVVRGLVNRWAAERAECEAGLQSVGLLALSYPSETRRIISPVSGMMKVPSLSLTHSSWRLSESWAVMPQPVFSRPPAAVIVVAVSKTISTSYFRPLSPRHQNWSTTSRIWSSCSASQHWKAGEACPSGRLVYLDIEIKNQPKFT